MHRTGFLILLLAVLFVRPLLVEGQEQQARTKGVFIGTATYHEQKMSGCSDLPDTRFDANDMKSSLVGNGTIAKSDAKLMVGRNTKASILAAIKAQAADQKPGDTLVIYNSSHGDAEGALCAYDGLVLPEDIAKALSDSKVGNVLIINDSCHSARMRVSIPGKQVAHINAAEGDKVAFSSDDVTEGLGHKNGALTKGILEGLKDRQADLDGDGVISSKEMAAYARGRTKLEERDNETHDYYNNSRGQKPNHRGDVIDFSTGGGAGDEQDQTVMVPRILSKTREAALASLAADGLQAEVRPFVDELVKGLWLADWEGKVARVVPKAGTRVPRGYSVVLYIPGSEHFVPVPDVIDLKASEAATRIRAARLVDRLQNQEHLVNLIRHQQPESEVRVVRGSTVSIAKGNADWIAVPDLEGLKPSEAKAKLEKMGFGFELTRRAYPKWTDYTSFPPFDFHGRVYATLPKAGAWQLEEDGNGDPTVVNCFVAPHDPVMVPNIQGMSAKDAKEAVEKVGLVLRIQNSRRPAGAIPGVTNFQPQPQAFKGEMVAAIVKYPIVPDLAGKTEREAELLCKRQKLVPKLTFEQVSGTPDFEKVVKSIPAAGTALKQGDEVKIVLPKGSGNVKLDVTAHLTVSSGRKTGRRQRGLLAKYTITGGTPPFTISGDGSDTTDKAEGAIRLTRPELPGSYQVRLVVRDRLGNFGRGAAPYKIRPPMVWATTMTGDIDATFKIFPGFGELRGEFTAEGLAGIWIGKTDPQKGNIWGGIVGRGPQKTFTGSFSGRRTTGGWRGIWQIDLDEEIEGRFEMRFQEKEE